jgi:hypothetical protein
MNRANAGIKNPAPQKPACISKQETFLFPPLEGFHKTSQAVSTQRVAQIL